MAFDVGAIVGQMKLDKKGWNESIQEVKADLKTMGDYVEKHKKTITDMGKTMTVVGTAIVGSLGLMIKKYVETGDQVDKMSKRTGFSAEALSELAYAADICGSNLDDIEKGVKRMSSSLVDAENGLMESKRAFNELGLSTKELLDMKPEEQFFTIADAISKLESPTKKAALAQDIFGRAGTKLLPLFAEGEKGLKALREEAHKLGIVFDKEAAAKAAKLKDAQTALKKSFEGIGFALADTIIPAITNFIKKITDTISKVSAWMKEHPKLTESIVKTAGAIGIIMLALGPMLIALPKIITLYKGIKGMELASHFTKLASKLGITKASFAALISPTGLVVIAVVAAAAAVAKLIITLNQLKQANEEVEAAEGRFEEANTKLANKLELIANRAGLTTEEFQKLKEKYDDNTMALAHAIFKGKEGVELQEAMAKVGKENIAVYDEQKKAIDELLKSYDVNIEDLIALEAKYGSYTAVLEAVKSGEETSIKKKQELSDIIGDVLGPKIEEVSQLQIDLADEVKKATLDEYEYAKYAAEQKYLKRKEQLDKEGADKQAYVDLEKIYATELNDIEADRLAKDKERKETYVKIWADYWAAVKAKHEEYKGFVAKYTDIINSYKMDEFEYKIWTEEEWYKEQLAVLKASLGDTEYFTDAKLLLDEAYAEKRLDIERQRAERQAENEQKEAEESRKLLEERLKHWMSFADSAGSAFGKFAEDVLGKNVTLGEGLKNLWTDLKQSFFSMIGDMVKEFMTNFVKNIILGTAQSGTAMEAGGKIFENVGKSIKGIGEGLGGLIKGIAEGIAAGIEALAKAIANAAKSLAGAIPELAALAALAVATFAAFKAVEALFGGGGGGKTEVQLIQQMRDKLYDIHNTMIGSFEPILTKDLINIIMDGNTVVGWILSATEGILVYVTAIKDHIANMDGTLDGILKALVAVPGAQAGGYFDRPTLVRVAEHGIPEYIIPAPQMVPAFAGQPLGFKSESRRAENNVNIIFKNTWNIPKEVAVSPKALENLFKRNIDGMTEKINQHLNRY